MLHFTNVKISYCSECSIGMLTVNHWYFCSIPLDAEIYVDATKNIRSGNIHFVYFLLYGVSCRLKESAVCIDLFAFCICTFKYTSY